VALRVLVVQHGEKEGRPGDPGLTAVGRTQAQAVADWLGDNETVTAIWSSPFRRATETAAPIAARFGLDVVCDARLRERMNWAGPPLESIEEFLLEWRRSSRDRSHRPSRGDSSEQAAHRFLAALDDIARDQTDGLVVVVAHGGVTVDLVRTLVGDESLLMSAPTLIDEGVPGGAITALRHLPDGWDVDSLPSTSHLPRSVSYCDFRTDDETFVVFSTRVFRYRRGDPAARELAAAHARAVGLPESQIDWPE